MREALALVGEEGLENMWKRHQRLHEDLWKGLGELGLEPFVQDPKDRLATVNTVKVCVGHLAGQLLPAAVVHIFTSGHRAGAANCSDSAFVCSQGLCLLLSCSRGDRWRGGCDMLI